MLDRVPPAIEMDDMRRHGQVQPRAFCLHGMHEEQHVVLLLEQTHQPSTLFHFGLASQHQAGPAEDLAEKVGERLCRFLELREISALSWGAAIYSVTSRSRISSREPAVARGQSNAGP